jgi:hypothetical protein
MTLADVLLIVVLATGLAAIIGFLALAAATDQNRGGARRDRIKDALLMNLPAAPFFVVVLVSILTDLGDRRYYGATLAVCAAFALAWHYLPPVRRARDRFRKTYPRQ